MCLVKQKVKQAGVVQQHDCTLMGKGRRGGEVVKRKCVLQQARKGEVGEESRRGES
jgi:hypothetical protein